MKVNSMLDFEQPPTKEKPELTPIEEGLTDAAKNLSTDSGEFSLEKEGSQTTREKSPSAGSFENNKNLTEAPNIQESQKRETKEEGVIPAGDRRLESTMPTTADIAIADLEKERQPAVGEQKEKRTFPEKEARMNEKEKDEKFLTDNILSSSGRQRWAGLSEGAKNLIRSMAGGVRSLYESRFGPESQWAARGDFWQNKRLIEKHGEKISVKNEEIERLKTTKTKYEQQGAVLGERFDKVKEALEKVGMEDSLAQLEVAKKRDQDEFVAKVREKDEKIKNGKGGVAELENERKRYESNMKAAADKICYNWEKERDNNLERLGKQKSLLQDSEKELLPQKDIQKKWGEAIIELEGILSTLGSKGEFAEGLKSILGEQRKKFEEATDGRKYWEGEKIKAEQKIKDLEFRNRRLQRDIGKWKGKPPTVQREREPLMAQQSQKGADGITAAVVPGLESLPQAQIDMAAASVPGVESTAVNVQASASLSPAVVSQMPSRADARPPKRTAVTKPEAERIKKEEAKPIAEFVLEWNSWAKDKYGKKEISVEMEISRKDLDKFGLHGDYNKADAAEAIRQILEVRYKKDVKLDRIKKDIKRWVEIFKAASL